MPEHAPLPLTITILTSGKGCTDMVTSESSSASSSFESVMLIKVYVNSPTSDVGAAIDTDGELSVVEIVFTSPSLIVYSKV